MSTETANIGKRIFTLWMLCTIGMFGVLHLLLKISERKNKERDEKLKSEIYESLMKNISGFYQDGQEHLAVSMIWPKKGAAIAEIGYSSLTDEYIGKEAYAINISMADLELLSIRILKTGEELEEGLKQYIYDEVIQYRLSVSMSEIVIGK